MSDEAAVSKLLGSLAPVLRRFGNRWYVFGAQAVLIWGRPRLTGDVVVTAFLDDDAFEAFVVAMADAGFTPRVADVAGFVRRTRVLPFLHDATRLPLDIVLGGPGPEEEFLRNAIEVDVAGTVVPVIAPEELVVTKILAGRPKDLDDVRGILQARGAGFDLPRARTLLRALEAALDQRDLVPLLDSQVDELAQRRK